MIMSSNSRVKVYILNKEGQWDDHGTGHIHVEMLQSIQQPGFRVISEQDEEKVLLQCKIHGDLQFQRQVETIITWADSEENMEIALSFQEAAGCQQIWERICKIRGEDAEKAEYIEDGDANARRSDVQLPFPELAKLPEILSVVQAATPSSRDCILRLVLESGYLGKFKEIFDTCEDLEDEDSLHVLFKIFKTFLLLNEPSLIEVLVSDDMVLHTMGILEYDPDIKVKGEYRKYIARPDIFKQPVAIKDAHCLNKIHTCFRLNYLKDVVMARYIDDLSYATYRELVCLNYCSIIKSLASDMEFMQELRRCCGQERGRLRYEEGFLFLQEMCDVAKVITDNSRPAFYKTLNDLKFIECFAEALKDHDPRLRNACLDCLMAFLAQSAALIRNFVVHSRGKKGNLMQVICEIICGDADSGVMSQLCEAVRVLLDPATMDQPVEKDPFLEVFYEDHLKQLLSPFRLEDKGPGSDKKQSSACGLVCELLSFCVQHHGYRMKHFIPTSNAVPCVLQLLHHREKYLVLAAIRFVRACIGPNDIFYNNYLVKVDAFAGVFHVLKKTHHRNNLISSAICELLEAIRSKNIRVLIKNITDRYREVLQLASHLKAVQNIIIKSEQNEEYEAKPPPKTWGAPTLTTMSTENRMRMAKFRELADEEDYFDRDDDDEEGSNTNNGNETNQNSGAISNLLACYDDAQDDNNNSSTEREKKCNIMERPDEELRKRFRSADS